MQYCSVWVFQIPTTVILVYYKAVFVVYIKLSMILLSCIILRSLFTINGYLLCVIFITFYHTVLQLMFFQQHFYNKRDDVESNSHLIVKWTFESFSISIMHCLWFPCFEYFNIKAAYISKYLLMNNHYDKSDEDGKVTSDLTEMSHERHESTTL